MTARSNHKRIGRIVAVVVAGTAFGVTGTLAVTAARPAQQAPQHQLVNLNDLADWAEAQQLTGLSPASLAPNAEARGAADLTAISEFAVAEGLSGLSPASVRPIDD